MIKMSTQEEMTSLKESMKFLDEERTELRNEIKTLNDTLEELRKKNQRKRCPTRKRYTRTEKYDRKQQN
jgi:prefoldin subunit 5